MDDLSVVVNGKVVDAEALEAVDHLLKKIKTADVWETIDLLVRVFEKRFPEYSKKRQEAMKTRKKLLKNPFGSNKEKDLRHLISIPVALKDLMDYFLEDYENVAFWREFARRYPQYCVPEKI